MNNREIIEYIVSNNLKIDEVIKRVEKDDAYENGMSVSYITNDGYNLYSNNGPVGILEFKDDESAVVTTETEEGEIVKEYLITYEIISERQYRKELDEKAKSDEINYLLNRLGELGVDVEITDDEEPIESEPPVEEVEEEIVENTETEVGVTEE